MSYPQLKPPTKAQIDADNNHKREKAIRADIHKIDDTIESDDYSQILELHRYLDGKYQYCIADWGKSMWGYNREFGFDYNGTGIQSLKENLLLMKPKLEAFMNGWNVVSSASSPMPTVPDINVNTTTNVNITISFEQVREKIEDMTALSQKETDEAIEKVNELEAISKENISRKSKWEKVKPIIAFAMDKGADLGIAILTLIVQMKLGM